MRPLRRVSFLLAALVLVPGCALIAPPVVAPDVIPDLDRSTVGEGGRVAVTSDARVGIGGTVLDRRTARGLADATVQVNDESLAAGPEGAFQVRLPPGTYRLSVLMTCYADAEGDVTVSPDSLTRVTVLLAESDDCDEAGTERSTAATP